MHDAWRGLQRVLPHRWVLMMMTHLGGVAAQCVLLLEDAVIMQCTAAYSEHGVAESNVTFDIKRLIVYEKCA